MFRLVVIVSCLLFGAVSWASEPMRVTFLNPGDRDDAFFGPLVRVMQAAADDLNIDLEVVDSHRNHLEMRRNGMAILERDRLPGYLLVINERNMAADIIAKANEKGVRVFLFNERLSAAGYQRYGKPREKLKNWLGELLPDDRQSGYLLAKTLIDEAERKGLRDVNGVLQMVGINGAFKTSSAEQRLLGLQDALKETSNVKLHQVVHAHWEEAQAFQVTEGLLKRYPQTTLIWAASDAMAQGAMRQVIRMGQNPGVDILIGGVDWADFAFDYVRKNDFAATVGGHFLDGAWSLIMLYDYHHGYDFRTSSQSSFSAITGENVDKFDRHFKTASDWGLIDFRAFTKTHKSYFAPYDFTLNAVFRHLDGK